MKYVIWSFEHGAWWGPNRRGYTGNIKKAGLYEFADAFAVCSNANAYGDINETMVPAALPTVEDTPTDDTQLLYAAITRDKDNANISICNGRSVMYDFAPFTTFNLETVKSWDTELIKMQKRCDENNTGLTVEIAAFKFASTLKRFD